VKRGPVHWVDGDLADPAVPARLVGEVGEHFGRLDVLVNNAGVTVSKPALELTADDFDAIFAVDVRAAFLAAQAAAKAMGEEGGVIVNVTSVHEHVPRPGFALYAPAKAALGMLTRSLALELAPSIRVVSVAPGAIDVERNEGDAERLRPEIPLGRAGRPEEVAALVSWVVSDEAQYATGASFLLDGGLAQQVVET
jgi:NAD(P)-dependent dehydrogenase (short-subunit alcohol dehydrogenase family)